MPYNYRITEHFIYKALVHQYNLKSTKSPNVYIIKETVVGIYINNNTFDT